MSVEYDSDGFIYVETYDNETVFRVKDFRACMMYTVVPDLKWGVVVLLDGNIKTEVWHNEKKEAQAQMRDILRIVAKAEKDQKEQAEIAKEVDIHE